MIDRSKSTDVYIELTVWLGLQRAGVHQREHVQECQAGPRQAQRAKYQVEHVMPQKLTDEWDDDLRSWGVENVAEFHQTYLHTIGNLSLSAIDPELSSMRLTEKKAEMADNWVPLNKDALAAEMWTHTASRNAAAVWFNRSSTSTPPR